MGEHDALRRAGRAARGDDEGVAGLDRPAVVERRLAAGRRSTAPAPMWASSAAFAACGQALVDGERRPRRGPTRRAARSTNAGPPGRSMATRRPLMPVEDASLPRRRHRSIMADAWTPGWWARARARCPPPSSRSPSAPAAPSVPGSVTWWRVAVALVVSLALQVGVNYANDYSDGVRGTDDARVGPVRLVASGPEAARRGQAGRVRRVRRRRGRRPRARRDDVVVAARRRGGGDRRGVVLHRRAPARTATPGSARCSCSCSSASSRRSARRTSRSSGSPG